MAFSSINYTKRKATLLKEESVSPILLLKNNLMNRSFFYFAIASFGFNGVLFTGKAGHCKIFLV